MDVDQGLYFSLKGTARHIWNLLDQPHSYGELCDRLRAHYRAPPGRIEADVTDFVTNLAERKLLTLS